MEDVKEDFLNLWPLYTRHTFEGCNLRAVYHTYFFGVLSLVEYEDEEYRFREFYDELKRRIDFLNDEKPYIDPLAEVVEKANKLKSNIKKPDYTW